MPVTCSACRARRDWLLLNHRRNVWVRRGCGDEWLEPEITRKDFDAMIANPTWTHHPDTDPARVALGFDGTFAGSYLDQGGPSRSGVTEHFIRRLSSPVAELKARLGRHLGLFGSLSPGRDTAVRGPAPQRGRRFCGVLRPSPLPWWSQGWCCCPGRRCRRCRRR